jgi:hypothetical protein
VTVAVAVLVYLSSLDNGFVCGDVGTSKNTAEYGRGLFGVGYGTARMSIIQMGTASTEPCASTGSNTRSLDGGDTIHEAQKHLP